MATPTSSTATEPVAANASINFKRPVDNRTLALNMAGFAAFGIGVRMWHLGIQKKSVYWRPRNHLIAAAVWAVIGYGAYHLELRQEEIIAEKLAVIRRNRDVQDAREAARKEMAQRIASGELKLKEQGEVDGLSPKQLYEDWRDLAKRHLEERQKENH